MSKSLLSFKITNTGSQPMDVSNYSREDLAAFSAVLDAAILEAAERDLDLPISLMTRRLFDAARWGERDPARLKAEILGDALHEALAAPAARGSVSLGQGYGLLPSHNVWSRSNAA